MPAYSRLFSIVQTVDQVIDQIRLAPFRFLIEGFNWKTALWSALLRSLLFCAILIQSGWRAAAAAVSAEALFRIATSGLFGSLMQAFRHAAPQWRAFLLSAVVLPGLVQFAEFMLHLQLGTPKLITTTIVSLSMTILAGLFQWHAMRRGALLVGAQSMSLSDELRAIPGLMNSFLFGWMRLEPHA